MPKYFTKTVFIGEQSSSIDDAINLAMAEPDVQLHYIVPIGGATMLLVFIKQPIPIIEKKGRPKQ